MGKHSGKLEADEKEIAAPVPDTKIEPEPHIDDEYSYDFDYEVFSDLTWLRD